MPRAGHEQHAGDAAAGEQGGGEARVVARVERAPLPHDGDLRNPLRGEAFRDRVGLYHAAPCAPTTRERKVRATLEIRIGSRSDAPREGEAVSPAAEDAHDGGKQVHSPTFIAKARVRGERP